MADVTERDVPVDSIDGEGDDAAAWARRMETPWGSLQASVLRRRLLYWLGDRRHGAILDVGCGIGDLAAVLASTTDRLVCVDRSPAMLAEARRRLEGSKAKVSFERRDLSDGLHELGKFDLVIAHNVVDYTPEPQQAVEALANQLKAGGSLSLVFGNGAAQALRHAVMTHDFNEALQLARLPELRLPGPCGESIRMRRPVVERWLQDLGLSVVQRAGVRILVDLLPNEAKTDATMPAIEELEIELGERAELVDIGALGLLFAVHP